MMILEKNRESTRNRTKKSKQRILKENREVLMDFLMFLATNNEEGQAIFGTTVKMQFSKRLLRKRSDNIEHTGK